MGRAAGDEEVHGNDGRRAVKLLGMADLGAAGDGAGADGDDDAACERARALGTIPSRSFAATKRQLRQPALDAVDRHGEDVDREVRELWSYPAIHASILGFLERTIKRK